jgi:hypothetical protein
MHRRNRITVCRKPDCLPKSDTADKAALRGVSAGCVAIADCI